MYSTLYDSIRSAAGDHGEFDENGTLIANTQRFSDDMIDDKMTLLLLLDDTYSKVSGSDAITPDFATNKAQGLFVCQVALALLVDDQVERLRTREVDMIKSDIMKIAHLKSMIKAAGCPNYGFPYAQDGALEKAFDLDDRIDEFVSENG